LILQAIGDSEFHGLGISKRIEQITHGTFRVHRILRSDFDGLSTARRVLPRAGRVGSGSVSRSCLAGVVALAAVAIPGRRASLLDPSVTLRRE